MAASGCEYLRAHGLGAMAPAATTSKPYRPDYCDGSQAGPAAAWSKEECPKGHNALKARSGGTDCRDDDIQETLQFFPRTLDLPGERYW